jgi:hypothetical protein
VAAPHSRNTKSLITKAAELAFAVPQVVAHRVMRMAGAGPTLSDRDRKEFQLMSAEKSEAFNESWNAMTRDAVRVNHELTANFLHSIWSPSLEGKSSASALVSQLQSAALGVLDRGMTPVHRKAVANAKRLARTKLR